jgi:hypothetical protein
MDMRGTAMVCERFGDEGLQADKLDALYGEADAAGRARLEAHLAACAACREEMAQLARLRRDLGAWRLPAGRPSFSPRGVVLPRWLAAAAVVLAGLGAALGATGYASLRSSLAAQEVRAASIERSQLASAQALEAALEGRPAGALDPEALLALLDARLEERLRASEALQAARVDRRLAGWEERAEARRRVDLARVAASLSYLDGRHGQQLARTNELMGYVLEASQRR